MVEAAEAGCSVIAFVAAPGAGKVRLHCAFRNRDTKCVSGSVIKWMRGSTKRQRDRTPGAGRGAQAVEVGAVDSLVGLLQRVAADDGWGGSSKEAGQRREVAVRWAALALAAVVESVLEGSDAAQHSRLEQVLRRSNARAALGGESEVCGRKKKTQEALALGLAALNRSSCLTSDQIQPEPELDATPASPEL